MKNSATNKKFADRANGFRNTAMADKLGRVRADIDTKPYFGLKLRKTVELGPDGTDHINVYKDCRTRLGNALSPFTSKPFVHPNFGPFNSREGLHYYLMSEDGGEVFRTLRPKIIRSFAYEKGIQLNVKYPNIVYFMAQALWLQIRGDENVLNMIRDNQLPFDAYFTSRVETDNGPHNVLIRPFAVALWSISIVNVISEAVKKGEEPNFDQFIDNKAALEAINARTQYVKKEVKQPNPPGTGKKAKKKQKQAAHAQTLGTNPAVTESVDAVDGVSAVAAQPAIDLTEALNVANQVFLENGIVQIQQPSTDVIVDQATAEQHYSSPEVSTEVKADEVSAEQSSDSAASETTSEQ